MSMFTTPPLVTVTRVILGKSLGVVDDRVPTLHQSWHGVTELFQRGGTYGKLMMIP